VLDCSVDNICLGCGLCCDGTLYSHVELSDADDIESLRSRGLRLRQLDGKDRFQQPCSAASGGCCAIYEARPGTCRTYRCALRSKYDAGAVTAHDARQLIAEAITLRDRLRPELERLTGVAEPTGLNELCNLFDKASPLDSLSRTRSAELRLDMGALSILLIRHFRTTAPAPLGAEPDAPMK
jgi:Fe-S-cluster containining protein